MARLTITLSDERHRALREAAVKRGKTIGQLIKESLEFYGIRARAAPRSWSARRAPAPRSARPKPNSALVTGDQALAKSPLSESAVLTPREFVDQLPA